jgi:hypothetical protein
MSSENGFVHVWWTADEFESQGGCGVAAADVVWSTQNRDDQVIDEIVRFSGRLGRDVDGERKGFGERDRRFESQRIWL